MGSEFCRALAENDTAALLTAPKSDLHNHSTKGCRPEWLAKRLNREIPRLHGVLDGLDGMQQWFRSSVKPFCDGYECMLIRWEGAFAEARRNNIRRLVLNFGVNEVDQVGGIVAFREIIEGLHQSCCPDTVFEPELTYPSSCNVADETAKLGQYTCLNYFKAIDICAGENVQPLEAFVPLYRKAEEFGLVRKMHVGETGSAGDVRKAVEILGLSEVHHGINAASSGEVMRFLADNHIQLNVCPSSNVKLGFVRDYRTHPIRILVENGVPVTINTDDLLIFDSTVENEYLLLYQAGTLTAEQLDDIRLRGLNGRTAL